MTPQEQIRIDAKRLSIRCLYRLLEDKASLPTFMLIEIATDIQNETLALKHLEETAGR